jgi:hypothetical protein
VTDYFWPQHLVPSASSWSLVANTAAFTSPLSGSTRTLARGGDRWRCSLTFDNLTSDKRAVLQAFLAQLRGQANRVYVTDHAYVKRGSFPTSNLLPDFSSAAPWTTEYATFAVADRVGRITATAHCAAQAPLIKAAVTVTNSAAYAMRAFILHSSTSAPSTGPALTAGGFASSYSTAFGLKTATLVTSSTSATASVVADSSGATMATGDYCDVPYASLSRCARVYGGSQTGLKVIVGNLDAAAGGLLAGDRVEINGEFNIVTDTVNSDGGGYSLVRLARPMRTSPADGAPVIIHDPVCKMMLADNTVSWSNVPGRFSSSTVELIEDIL